MKSAEQTINENCKKSEKTVAQEELWNNGPFKQFYHANNQQKGDTGSQLVVDFYACLGVDCEVISDQGDIKILGSIHEQFKGMVGGTSEVKTSRDLDPFIARGVQKKKLWVNQVRPNEKGWRYLHLVLVCPDGIIYIWEFTREEYFYLSKKYPKMFKSGHIGSDDLRKIGLEKNSSRDDFQKIDDYLLYKGKGEWDKEAKDIRKRFLAKNTVVAA